MTSQPDSAPLATPLATLHHPALPKPTARLGLGCGGPSRLGLRTHEDADRSRQLVRRAIDLGITLLDTASTYGTEPIVGDVVGDLPPADRDRLTICTKHPVVAKRGVLLAPDAFASAIDTSLQHLRIDRIDLFQLHGVTLEEYPHAIDAILPVCREAQAAGKIDRLGITEAFVPDPTHRMLLHAHDRGELGEVFRTAMVGFNVLNQNARAEVLPAFARSGAATLIMFAVRRALTDEAKLRETLATLHTEGLLETDTDPSADPLRWFADLGFGDGTMPGLIADCYRFSRDTPTATVMLSGTGNADHLEANARAMAAPPLDPEVCRTLARVFARVQLETAN